MNKLPGIMFSLDKKWAPGEDLEFVISAAGKYDQLGPGHSAVQGLTLGPVVHPGEVMDYPPLATLNKKDATYLASQLWEAGIKPDGWEKETKSLQEKVTMLEAHLEDMRKVAMSFIELKE